MGEAMFTGDNLLPHITPNPVLEPCLDGTGARVLSLPTYIATLTKLEDMPVRKGLPGHGGEIPNVKERIAEIKQHHGLRTGEVRAILELAGEGLTPFECALRLYSVLEEYDVFLGVSEVWGHLDLLEEQDLATSQKIRGCYRYWLK